MAKLILDKVCKLKKVSRRELARRMGISHPNALRLFRKDANPTFATLARAAHALGCKVRDLIKE